MSETVTKIEGGNWTVVPTVEPTPVVTSPAKPVKVKKEPKQPVLCWCGCGGKTMGKFVPGHDAKFHGEAKKHARAIVEAERAGTEMPPLRDFIHDAARDDFMKWVNSSLPKFRAEAEAKALLAAARAEK